MTREEALDVLALACLTSAVDDPGSGTKFGEELATLGVSLGDTAEVVARMMRLVHGAATGYDEAIRVVLASRRRG